MKPLKRSRMSISSCWGHYGTDSEERWWEGKAPNLRGPWLACLALPIHEHQGPRGWLLMTSILPFVGVYTVPVFSSLSSVLSFSSFLPPIHAFSLPILFFSLRWFPGSSLRWVMGSTSPDLLPALHTSSVLWPGLPARVFLAGLLRCPCGGCLSPCELWAEPGMYKGEARTYYSARLFSSFLGNVLIER